MTSVAGKIRVDLIAEAARFKAGLREGRQELGSFAEATAAFNRSFESQAQSAKRAEDAIRSWGQTMLEVRGQMLREGKRGVYESADWGEDDPQGARGSKTYARERRLKAQLPWGHTMRVTLSREAAETAAAIGRAKDGLAQKLADATRELTQQGAQAAGVGGVLQRAHGLLGRGALGLATGVAGLVTYWAIQHARHERRQARETGALASIWGQGVEDTSRLRGAGIEEQRGSHFLRALAERSEAFGRLKLDPEKLGAKPMKDALLDVSRAFGEIKNPADRARIAQELFGRSAGEMIPILANLKKRMDDVSSAEIVSPQQLEQTRAFDQAWKRMGQSAAELSRSAGRRFGVDAGFGTTLIRGVAMWAKLLRGDLAGARQLAREFGQADANVRMAEQRDRAAQKTARMAASQKEAADHAERHAKALRDAAEAADAMARPSLEAWQEAVYGRGYVEDRKIEEQARAAGKSTEEINANQALRVQRRREAEAASGAQAAAESLKTPEQKYDEAIHQAKVARDADRQRSRVENERIYQALAKKALEDYYREAAGLDARQLAQQSRSTVQQYQERIQWLRQMREQDVISAEVEQDRAAAERRQVRRDLGVRDYQEDYRESYRRLAEGRAAGLVGEEEFAQRREELRREAVGQATAGQRPISPIAAMQAGSREAYSMIVQSQLADPKVKLAQQTNQILDKIEENTRVAEQNSRPERDPALVGTPFDV